MARVGLEPELAGRFPHQLSGGQRQRVAWARALAAEPRVLLLDEPFSALDPPLRRALAKRVAELAEAGRAILWVGHDLGEATERADRLGILAAGRLVELGPAKRLLAAPEHPLTRALVAAHRDPLG
jgi:ABC-type proline/glycine betaine transport system ATPase subunit